MFNENIEICKFNKDFNRILGTNFDEYMISYSEVGLSRHMRRSRHENCIKYINSLKEIIQNADYIGQNPRHEKSFEIIKKLDGNILVAIKLNQSNDGFYVASIYDISNFKLQSYLEIGRIKLLKNLDNDT